MTTSGTNRKWTLVSRPQGLLKDSDFALTSEPIPAPGEGEILVKTLMLSCDPTQRAWLAIDTYLPAVKIGEVVRAFGAARVVESKHPDYKAGDLISGLVGWQEYAALKPKLATVSKLPAGAPIPLALGALGMTGLTAYFGLLDVGRPEAGETVLVSGAAGATGSVAGQIAKIKGCKTIGIAGGAEKCAWLLAHGFDAAIDYKSEDVGKRIAALCPRGIDIYFDNVGGSILDAALARLARKGRVVLCGGISTYTGSGAPDGLRNYMNLVVQRGRIEGFLITDYAARFGEGVRELAGWLREGKVTNEVDIQHGLENAPATLNRLFEGKNHGKQLLQIAE